VDIQILNEVYLCYVTLEGAGPSQLYCFRGIKEEKLVKQQIWGT